MDTPTIQLISQPKLCQALEVGKSLIDDRIARYPKGHPNEFPVEYIGRFRRFDPERVRAWFAAENNGFVDTDSESPAPSAA